MPKVDHRLVKLGKQPPKRDRRRLSLGRYLVEMPPAPPVVDWLSGITEWGMMRNDALGDCTIAAVGHAVQVWTAATGSICTVDDILIQAYYSKWAGYVEGDESTDNGAAEVDILNRWRSDGFEDFRLLAYVDPELGNREHFKKSVELFGGVYLGVALPVSAQNQPVWDVVDPSDPNGVPGSWGGHAVFCPYYNEIGPKVLTWGGVQQVTWGFVDEYVDEIHTLLSQVWLDRAAPDFNYPALADDLTLVGNQPYAG